MMWVKNSYKIGDMVKVEAIDPPCIALPEGLPDGATVKIVAIHTGYEDVEYEGKIYHVSMVLIDSGHQSLGAIWEERKPGEAVASINAGRTWLQAKTIGHRQGIAFRCDVAYFRRIWTPFLLHKPLQQSSD